MNPPPSPPISEQTPKFSVEAARQLLEEALEAEVPANAYTPEIIDQVGKSVGMDVARMRTDMNSKEVREAVKASISDYEKVGLEGTPSFFINGTYVGGFGEQHLNDIVKQARDKVKT